MCPTKTNRQQFGGRHIQVCAPTAPPLPFFFKKKKKKTNVLMQQVDINTRHTSALLHHPKDDFKKLKIKILYNGKFGFFFILYVQMRCHFGLILLLSFVSRVVVEGSYGTCSSTSYQISHVSVAFFLYFTVSRRHRTAGAAVP